MVCQSKLSYAQGMFSFQNATTGNNNSTDRSYSVQCHNNDDSHLRFCSGTLRVDSVYNEWWSFVLSHCNSTRGLNISYEFNFTDGHFWNAETSTRRVRDIFDSHLISLAGYLLLFMASLHFARHLRRRGMLHPAFKLFMTTLGFKTAAVLFDFIFHTDYVLSGLELSLFTISEVLHATSEIVLIVLLILLAFGCTITKARLKESIQTKLKMFLSSYTLIFGILFVLWAAAIRSGSSSICLSGKRSVKIVSMGIVCLWYYFFNPGKPSKETILFLFYGILFCLVSYKTGCFSGIRFLFTGMANRAAIPSSGTYPLLYWLRLSS